MDRLGALDAAFLDLTDGIAHVHIARVSILEDTSPDAGLSAQAAAAGIAEMRDLPQPQAHGARSAS